MSLLEGSVTIRGVAYTVREISGRHMREVRKRLKDAPETVEAYLAWACTTEPKFASEQAAADESHLVLKTLSEKAFELSQPPAAEEATKND
jgi:hypothetical protein